MPNSNEMRTNNETKQEATMQNINGNATGNAVILPSPKSSRMNTGVPRGTYIGIVQDVKAEYGVVRQKYDAEPGVTETVDQVRFAFELKNRAGKTYHLETKAMRLSTHEKSTLYGFLTAMLGAPPQPGLNLMTLIGTRATVIVVSRPGRTAGVVFSDISSVGPCDELDATVQDAATEAIPSDAL